MIFAPALVGLLLFPAAAGETTLSVPSDAGTPVGVCDLGATLERPTNAKAIVVFVHGSGTHDRDESIGAAKPFRDLARGLSARGIASLRYDKRGFDPACRAAAQSPQLSPNHFIADISNVFRRAQVEGLPAFLLGHSEGVTYVNEAAARGLVAPAGLVLLAGLGRYTLEETLMRQLGEGLAAHDRALAETGLTPTRRAELEASKAELAATLAEGRAFFARSRAGQAAPDERFFGAFTGFWREENAMTARASAQAAAASRPSLLLQGDADRNVTREDFDALRLALLPSGGSSAWLAGLDHLFLSPGSTAVDAGVPQLVADWIDARLAAPSLGNSAVLLDLAVSEEAFP